MQPTLTCAYRLAWSLSVSMWLRVRVRVRDRDRDRVRVRVRVRVAYTPVAVSLAEMLLASSSVANLLYLVPMASRIA